MDKWIKCKDRMPERNQELWFVANSHPKCPTFGTWDDHFSSKESITYTGYRVTHWMPFERPEPPEPEESELVKRCINVWNACKAGEQSIGAARVLQEVRQFEREHNK